jgi:hypothetical protein
MARNGGNGMQRSLARMAHVPAPELMPGPIDRIPAPE